MAPLRFAMDDGPVTTEAEIPAEYAEWSNAQVLDLTKIDNNNQGEDFVFASEAKTMPAAKTMPRATSSLRKKIYKAVDLDKLLKGPRGHGS